ncbi:MAG: FoF1 ATP synthase subunit gamma [Candidatus Brocadiia bacterium]
MAELRELQRKLESIRSLQDVVNAMRNLAAVYVRRAEGALDAIRPYADIVTTALSETLERPEVERTEPSEEARCLAVVFAGDQGLAGSYNDRIVTAAREFREQTAGPVDIFCIGLRGANLLEMRGVRPVGATRTPSSLEGIESRMPELAARIFELYRDCGAEQMYFVYTFYESMGRFDERVRRIVPPVREALRPGLERRFSYQPILTAPPSELLPHLIEEYFFVELYRSLLESHASENGARLTAMTSAATNVEDRLEDLQQQYQHVRQESITSELMDVVSGAEAQSKDDRQ